METDREKQVKVWTYGAIALLSLIECYRMAERCEGAGKAGTALIGAICALIGGVMCGLWWTNRGLAARYCSFTSNTLFSLLLVGSVIGAENATDNDMWLAFGALPALLLAVTSWHDARGEYEAIGDETDLESLAESLPPLPPRASGQQPTHRRARSA